MNQVKIIRTTQGLRMLKELEALAELKRDVYFENVEGV